ncbi:hypothetical protein LOTGIDRAFT_170042 [Lottia gigantea]|uniref:Uncharacterized protein n=1 Tax=Lottia gigantea TaxID=225164 RepID=V4B298_LOTGI|nr:hypothetical protein LOTGIDRAFT_170042 [Lottia gigantea]ESO82414.1 hypothetical protein LOTGIDRAFT_170042 [Lottia gigantea]
MEPPPPSYNEAVTNSNYFSSTSIDLDDDSEELGSSVDPLRDEVHGAESSQYEEDAETNALLESEDVTPRNYSSPVTPPNNVGESHFRTSVSPYSSGESQLRASGSHHVSGSPPQTPGSQNRATGSHPDSGTPLHSGESQNRTSGSFSSYGTPSQTAESQNRTSGSFSGTRAPSQTTESQYRSNGSPGGFGIPSQTGTTRSSSEAPSQIAESHTRTTDSPIGTETQQQTREVQSTPSAQPDLTESSAQTQPPPPSYDEAFMRPGQARNNMQISRSALSGAYRDPLLDPEQPPPSYSAVVSSQGSRYYPPVNAGILNSSYATQPSTSGPGINRYPAERTYGSGAHGSYNYQGYQRMPHGSYIPVIHNANEQSGFSAPSIAIYNSFHPARPTTSTGVPGNVQGYNTTPLAYVDPNSIPQEKTNTCGKLCTLCVCVGLIFIPLIIYLMLLN